jgi:aspartyl/glutamyl-tRNA(Asn/Gln) amidotransferase C subunit
MSQNSMKPSPKAPEKVVVTEALTRKVADLARLALTESEIVTYTQQIQKTLLHVDQLSEVSIPEGTQPLFSPLEKMETPLREDVVVDPPKEADGKPKTISHAPEVLYDGFKVPPII